jgi:hypothetical protein
VLKIHNEEIYQKKPVQRFHEIIEALATPRMNPTVFVHTKSLSLSILVLMSVTGIAQELKALVQAKIHDAISALTSLESAL